MPGRIVIDPAVCGGRPHFHDTRVPVYVVLEMLANRETRDDIHENYPALTKDDVYAALEYARNIASIPRQSPVLVPA